MQMHQDTKPRCGILVHLKRRIRHVSYIVYVRGTHIIGLIIFGLEVLIQYNNTAEKTRRRLYGLIQSGYLTLILYFFCDFFTLDFSPSTFNPRLFTVDFLPSTFYPRLLTLDFLPSTFYPRLFTLDFLPSPSTFYPRPRLFTLALDFLPSTLDTRPIDKLLQYNTYNTSRHRSRLLAGVI